jgi:hypothetical protein
MTLEAVHVIEVNITRPKIVSGARMMVFSSIISHISGGPQCLPAEIESALPRADFKTPTHREHPTEMSTTVDAGLRAKEPVNGSTLVIEHPHEPSPDQA